MSGQDPPAGASDTQAQHAAVLSHGQGDCQPSPARQAGGQSGRRPVRAGPSSVQT